MGFSDCKSKGVILAGGSGTRLHPLTISVNKHLLPVGKVPMIVHCVKTLVRSGLKDILIVTNPEYVGHFSMLLKSGKEFGCKITYKTQDEPNGVAGALYMAKEFAAGQPVVVLLGDNMFKIQGSLFDRLRPDEDPNEPSEISNYPCRLLFKKVQDGHRYGIGEFDIVDGIPVLKRVKEKPEGAKAAMACVGLYKFPPTVFDVIEGIKPSARGELEIADVINHYIQSNSVGAFFLKDGEFWTDAGTMDSYRLANSEMWDA